MDETVRTSNDESPFGYPALMDGYPLEPDEESAIERVLADYRRQHDAETDTPPDVRRVPKPDPSPV